MKLRVACFALLSLSLSLASCGGEKNEGMPAPAGKTDAGGSAALPAPPAGCATLGIKTIDEAETKLIAPTCGMGPPGQTLCHSMNMIYPPRMATPGMIAAALVNKKAVLSCMNDFYVNKADIKKSFLLAKINAMDGKKVECPSGPGPAMGGDKMPNMPAGPLKPAELECITWYVSAIAAATK